MSKVFIFISLLAAGLTHSLASADLTGAGGDAGSSFGTSGTGSGDKYVPSEAKLECLLQAASEGSSNNVKDISGKAESLRTVLEKMNWSSSEFNDVSLAHFLSQCTAESAMGNNNKEGGGGTGTGWIQVSNDGKAPADRCAKEKGLGGISSASGQDQTAACAVSMCWWEASIIKNDHNKEVSKEDSNDAAKRVSEMVNMGHDAGGTGEGMTGGSANAEKRAKTFKTISDALKGKCHDVMS